MRIDFAKTLLALGCDERFPGYQYDRTRCTRVLFYPAIQWSSVLHMKTLTVRLPETLVAEIQSESRRRNISKSDVVRERLQSVGKRRKRMSIEAIADLIGSVEGLPPNLSVRKKEYLRTGYGKKRSR